MNSVTVLTGLGGRRCHLCKTLSDDQTTFEHPMRSSANRAVGRNEPRATVRRYSKSNMNHLRKCTCDSEHTNSLVGDAEPAILIAGVADH